MDVSALKARLERAARALPWPNIGVAAAVVVVGISQIFFSLLTENADYFPKGPWFPLGVLLWIAALPFGAVLSADLTLKRWGGHRGFAVWRALLYTFLFASALRQTQVYYPAPFQWLVERIPPRPLMYGMLALVFLLCLRSKVLAHRYVAALGLLGATLIAFYAWRTGLFGEAWRNTKAQAAASRAAWSGDPVLICVFDEMMNDILLKDGQIDAELHPNIAAFSKDSAWFTNARTNHMFTKNAFPCMLTGRLEPPDGAPTLFDYVPASCEVVARDYFPPTYGWLRRHARDGQTLLLCGFKDEPLQDFLGIPGALHEVFEQTPFSRSPFAVNPGRRLMPPLLRAKPPSKRSSKIEIDSFLATVNASYLTNKFIFWHCQIPHFPFEYNPDGTKHDDEENQTILGPGSFAGTNFPPGYSLEKTLDNYRKQVRFADKIFGQIVDLLKRDGLYERTTLILTSDHGLRTFGGAQEDDYPEVMSASVGRVPLMIRGPRVKNGVYPVEYFHVDFTPTVLDAVGIPYDPAAFEGVSAFAAARPIREPVIFNAHLKPFRYEPAGDRIRMIKPRQK